MQPNEAAPESNTTYEALAELALNLRWSWHRSSDELWGRLDPDLWDLTQNPWVVLQTVSGKKLAELSADPAFSRRVHELLDEKRTSQQEQTWFPQAHPDAPLSLTAYFSMEYMLSEALPIYSGGLGNVAGDQLKAASDLSVPVVAIGLLYQQGYFRQQFDSSGNQLALYPFNDPGQLPIRPLRLNGGQWLRLPVHLPGLKLWIRAWEVHVGRRMLYLLDSNDPANAPAYRGVTSELYGGTSELRLRQEAVLGIGGWRLLHALGLNPDVCHLNEGHAAFAVLERARAFMEEHKQPFEVALAATRAGNVFTTHTAVEAGFDRFAPDLVAKYLTFYAEQRLHISVQQLMALGRRDPNDASEPFNMAWLALHGSAAINGVSRLHGEVSRRLFQPLFPRWPQNEVPVGHVTNGIHVPTWESPEADAVGAEASGHARWQGDIENHGDNLRATSDERLWQLRTSGRKALVDYTRERLRRQRASEGASPDEVAAAARVLDPETLTLGFARRFATYKRPTLLLYDPERLVRILTNQERPVQLVLAGKAHPQDIAGQVLIRRWNDFARRPDVRSRVVFLSDYDMMLTQQLVQGVDLWINTPRRPWEASGTSGMKVLANCGLNLSVLDGWWVEAFTPEVGWAIGNGQEHGDDPAWDGNDADQLYTTLEQDIVPEFYRRDQAGIPDGWIAKMRESMARLVPFFSANRVIRDYTSEFYIPAASSYRKRAADGGKLGAEIAEWQKRIAAGWGSIRFGDVKAETHDGQHEFEVQVFLGELEPGAVQVQLYADAADGGQPVRETMKAGGQTADSGAAFLYSATIPANRPANDYTPRVIPFHPDAVVPLEAPYILWQR